ncbi:MAG TPA: MFS transporter [Humisphaera sp.]|nr:MFS transporter [Humisphaera sp.]
MRNDEDTRSNGRWLNRTVLGIGLASLFSDVGHEMATTAMPALLATLGVGSAALGLIEGLADGLSSFAKLFSGLYSDKLATRKPLAVVGYFITAAGMASFALATQWWHVLLGRIVGWLGRGVRSPVRNVLLTDATTPQTHGRAFGLERAMDSAGAVLGPCAALLLLGVLGTAHFHWLFAFTLIPGILAALCIALLVREKPHEPQHNAGLASGMRNLPTAFYRYLIGIGVAGIGDFSKTLLILWATQALTPRLGIQTAAEYAMLFYVGYNVVYTVSCYVSGSLADRFPKNHVLATGYALAVIPAVALMLPSISLIKFAVVFGFSGVYMGVWETVENSTAATVLPKNLRGTGFGVLATVQGFGDLISSIVVGCLWALHPSLAMGFVIVTAVVGAAIIAATPPAIAASEGAPQNANDFPESADSGIQD